MAPPEYGIDFVDSGTAATIQKKENKTGLPESLQFAIEDLSGLSMAGVRVHYDSAKPAQFQALAYTRGTDIHVAPGQERHLAHEAWHVVQQRQGRVRATRQVRGAAINDDSRLEREADAMAGVATRRSGARAFGDGIVGAAAESAAAPVIQRLNTVSVKKASDQAVQHIDSTIGGSQLLSGWKSSTAGAWMPGRSGHGFTVAERTSMNAIGDTHGCCICNTTDPGTKPVRQNNAGKNVGNFILDHEPPNTLVGGGYTGAIRFYPHCLTHSNWQAGVVASYKAQMKAIRAGTDSDWATGVQGSWFWN